MRLLHISDLHLDRAFASMGCQGQLARRRRQGLRDALRRAGALAQEHGCDAITIGGDLYEHDRAGADTAAFLADTFALWAPIPVLIAPGNHDPLVPGSLYSRTDWPANVHIFGTDEFTEVAVAGVRILGLGHREHRWQGDPLATSPDLAAEGALALFHGAEMGSRPDGKSIHGPFHQADIRKRGFRAALCGHYHRRRLDAKNRLLYPGSPEPLTFDESGGRGPVLVDVPDSGDVTFTALDVNAWNALSVNADVSSAASLDTAVDIAAATLLPELTGLDPERTLVRIDLEGDVDSAVSLDVVTVESRLREMTGLAVVRVRDTTCPGMDIEAARIERTARGAFARTTLDAMAATDDDDERALLDDALRYGLMALSGADVGLR